VGIKRAECLADVAVVAALHREHGSDQAAVGINHGTATKRGGNRVHRAVQLGAGDRVGAGSVDAAGGQVGQSGPVGAVQGGHRARVVVIRDGVRGHAFDVADTTVQVVHPALDHPDALVGFEQLGAGDGISAVGADFACSQVGQHRAVGTGKGDRAVAAVVVEHRRVADDRDTVGHLVELGQVHRIGVFGARGHVDDLTLAAPAAHRYRAGAVGNRIGTQRHAVVGKRLGEVAHRGAVVAGRGGE